MSLHAGLDTVAIITGGVFTKTYGASAKGAIANLFTSRGWLEDAPNTAIKIANILMNYYRRWRIS